jgi:hypothetical protein
MTWSQLRNGFGLSADAADDANATDAGKRIRTPNVRITFIVTFDRNNSSHKSGNRLKFEALI